MIHTLIIPRHNLAELFFPEAKILNLSQVLLYRYSSLNLFVMSDLAAVVTVHMKVDIVVVFLFLPSLQRAII